MFIPKDRAVVLQLPKHDKDTAEADVRSIVANRERRLIGVATRDAVYVWLANPQLLLCSIGVIDPTFKESAGELRKIYWKPDSSSIAVTTNQNKILIYNFEVNYEEQCYNFTDSADPYFQRNSPELFIKGNRPVAHLHPTIIINLADVPTCCVPSRDEFIVCLQNGFTHHVTWTGEIISSLSFRVNSIPFSNDQLQSRSENVASKSTYIVDAVYAPLLGGFAVVLSDGQGALLTSNDPNFAPNAILGVWAPNLKDATCCDVNHKFLLVLFGCRNGDVCAYNIDELNGSLVQSFRVAPKVTNGPDFTNRLGPVYSINALASGYGFAAVWAPKKVEKTESSSTEVHPLPRLMAVFTPFGAQSFCNLEGFVEDHSGEQDDNDMYTALEWGPEGYQLWLGTRNELRMQAFIRSASCSSPIMEHCDRAVLISDSQVLISAARDREADACAPHSVWDHITVTHEYLSSCWPLRYASTDRNYNHLVVAGDQGLAYCSLSTRRWKIFGNETQEKNLLVTGGVFIWNDDVIGVVAVNADTDKSHLSFYPISERLDNRFASVIELENKSVMSALRDDVCAVFDISAQITLYKLTAHNDSGRDSFTKVSGEIVTVIRINEIVPHPTCIVSLQMTQLNLDVCGKLTPAFYSSIDTVLVNISGRLITLSVNEEGKLHQPMVIASYVEKMWHDRCIVSQSALSQTLELNWNGHRRNGSNVSVRSASSSEPASPLTQHRSSHLSNALWIACGAKGIKVWMPLVPGKRTTNTQEMTFIAKRIMLPFELDIYPIVISARDCLAMGVESQLQHVARASRNNGQSESISMYGLHRNSEVFVHHLLRQLLKRNLGVFALELAGACRSLPHFTHALELLLHGVLEEEATSSEPIPDPLLPRCVAFIHEFPEFLKTVAHCARKTELALWRALFDVTGSPNALFEECLQQKQLENAASFVIVLQNLETTEVSMEQAARLVKEALAEKKWTIAKEMVRFARSIGSEDIDAISPPQSAKTSISRRPTVSSPSAESTNEFFINRFQAGAAARLSKVRHSQSTDQKDSQRKDSLGSSNKTALTRGLSGEVSPQPAVNRLAARMTAILEEHAWHLLNNYWILDLGFFWSELQFDLPGLLETRRKQTSLSPKNTNDNCYLIEDFSLALTRLHAQFSWPYPVIGSQFVHQIEKKLGNIRVSQSTASLNGLIASESAVTSKPKARKTEKTVIDLNGAQRRGSNENSEDDVEIQEAVLERVMGSASELVPVLDRSPSTSSSVIQPSLAQSPATPSSCDSRSVAGDWQNTDFLVGEKSSRGNLESSRQIELMLYLFSQTAAIDWIFLLCLISRDERKLRQEINVSMVRRAGEKSFARVRFACSELGRWAVEKCCGYVALLQAFDAHLSVVAEQAGIADLKFASNGKERRISSEGKNEDRGRHRTDSGGAKLNNSFTKSVQNGVRRERSRSADRAHKSVKRYDDVVCAEDALEKADEEGCSIM